MKKIMFKEKFSLESAVFDRSKTMTRRRAKYRGNKEIGFYRWPTGKVVGDGQYLFIEVLDPDNFSYEPEQYIRSQYHVGEIVAIAQSYREIMDDRKNWDFLVSKGVMRETDHWVDCWMCESAGFSNKLFVKPELMPHHIRITGIKAEFLQDISDEDCLREGIYEHLKGVQYGFRSNMGYCGQYPFSTPRDAFAALIDKVSGKGTWQNNQLQFAYDFEWID